MTEETVEERETVTIRRAPRMSVFIVVGALLGFLATLILTSMFTPDPQVGFSASLGYFLMYGIPIGILLAGGVGLLFDRRAHRRAIEVIAGKLTVHAEEESSTADGSTEEDGAPDSIPSSVHNIDR